MAESTRGSAIADETQPLPHELATIPEILASVRLPESSFDPDGQWISSMVFGWSRETQPASVRRRDASDPASSHRRQACPVRRTGHVLPQGRREERLEAEIACAMDSLSTP